MRKPRIPLYSLIFSALICLIFGALIHSCKKLEAIRVLKIQTGDARDISFTESHVDGAIVDVGEGQITEHGHVWATQQNPTILNSRTNFGSRNTGGGFTSNLAGLDPGITYYVRAYARKGEDTFYGESISFATQSLDLAGVDTKPMVNITSHSAETGGNIFSDGGSEITARGVCWGTSTGPNIEGPHTTDGNGPGEFNSTIDGLDPGTEYHVRAYATNSEGTAYGNEIIFGTHPVLPELGTLTVIDVTTNSAVSGGNITYDGGAPITQRGLCWNTAPGPTLDHFTTNEGGGSGTFSSAMTGLEAYTHYYVRAYAINAAGVQYGNELEFRTAFNCGTRLTDDRDGKTYLTVQIGEQCWMAENLNIGDMIPGANDQTDNGIIEKYCFDDNPDHCALYGGIYQWEEMMQYTTMESSRGICPDGWHLPSDFEWKILEMALGMSQESADSTHWRGTDEGGKLKAAGTAYWDPPNLGATNSSLFTALPAGGRNSTGSFEDLGFYADFWTSTLIINQQSWYRYLDADHSKIYRVDGFQLYGTSVRCVKD